MGHIFLYSIVSLTCFHDIKLLCRPERPQRLRTNVQYGGMIAMYLAPGRVPRHTRKHIMIKDFFYYRAKYPYAPLPPQRRRETDPGAGGGEAGCPGPCRPRSLRCVSRILIRKTLCLLYKSFRTYTKSIPGPCRVSPQWASACSTVSQRYLYVS